MLASVLLTAPKTLDCQPGAARAWGITVTQLSTKTGSRMLRAHQSAVGRRKPRFKECPVPPRRAGCPWRACGQHHRKTGFAVVRHGECSAKQEDAAARHDRQECHSQHETACAVNGRRKGYPALPARGLPLVAARLPSPTLIILTRYGNHAEC